VNPKHGKGIVRVLNVPVSERHNEALRRCSKRHGCADTETIRRAVQLLDAVMESKEEGMKLAVVTRDGQVVRPLILWM